MSGGLGGKIEQEHYTVQQLAAAWGLSQNYVRGVFQAEAGVLRFQAKVVTGHRRGRTVLRIPREVAERVYRRMGGGEIPKVR